MLAEVLHQVPVQVQGLEVLHGVELLVEVLYQLVQGNLHWAYGSMLRLVVQTICSVLGSCWVPWDSRIQAASQSPHQVSPMGHLVRHHHLEVRQLPV